MKNSEANIKGVEVITYSTLLHPMMIMVLISWFYCRVALVINMENLLLKISLRGLAR